MEHTMKLYAENFKDLVQDKKVREYRLNDAKRKLIKQGDTIRFQKLPNYDEEVLTEVTKKEELIAALKAQLNEVNLNLKKHYDDTDKEVARLSSEYNKTRIEWQKEKQEMLNQIENLKYSEKECKDENDKLKKEKAKFKDDLKKYVSQIVDEKIIEIKAI